MALYNHLSKDIKEHAEGLHTSFRLISKTDDDLERMITNWNKENEDACGFSLIYDPNFCLIISLSLMLSPQELTTIISEDLNLGAILIASAKACEGSKDGEIFSNLETN